MALVFLFSILAMAGAVYAIPGNTSPVTISITEPDANEYIRMPSTLQKQEALVNFTYTPTSDNNVSWCKIISNGTYIALSSTIERSQQQYFKDVALTNGTWWYYIQCRDNYTNLHNSTNRTVNIVLDDVAPTITVDNSVTTYNTTNGRTVFKVNAIDMETGIENCTLFVEDEKKGYIANAGNGTSTFPEIVLTEGDYMWKVLCEDKAGNVGESSHGLLIAELTTSQMITLNSPIEDAVDLDGYVTFKYTPKSRLPLRWCTLELNESVNGTNSDIVNNSVNMFEQVHVKTGPYNWSITCHDSEGNNVTSSQRNLWVNKTILMSEYINVKATAPEDYENIETGNVNFKYIPRALLGLNRCELITNKSVREVKKGGTSDEETAFSMVSVSEGIWEWRIRCIDDSDNEYNSELRTLVVKGVEPIPIPDKPEVPIGGDIPEKDVSEIVKEFEGRTKTLGIDNALWVAIVIITLFIVGVGTVIVVDKKFEMELIKDWQLLLFKLKIRKEPPESKKKHALTDRHKNALKKYIAFHMKNGVERKKLEMHLKNNKWSDEHIKIIFNELEDDWNKWRDKIVEKR
jgi:hypothetical protein